jgi:hypothetical protein
LARRLDGCTCVGELAGQLRVDCSDTQPDPLRAGAFAGRGRGGFCARQRGFGGGDTGDDQI